LPVAERERVALRGEMSISRADFLRTLPAAVAHDAFEVVGDEVVHRGDGRSWRIVLRPMPDLVIASLALPRHAVEIRLEGYDDAGARNFVERFELHFRRGGG
jgi:hypothetical protein